MTGFKLLLVSLVILFPLSVMAQEPDPANPGISSGVQSPNDVATVGRIPRDQGYGIVKFQLGPGQLAGVKSSVAAANKAGLATMVSIAKNPTGFSLPSEDPTEDGCIGGYDEFRQFTAKTAKDLPTVQYFEIGNEPNLDGEWDAKWGKYSAIKFAKLVECGAAGIKEGNPGAKVITGAFSPNGAGDAGNEIGNTSIMLSALNLANIDYIGAHLYTGTATPPTDKSSEIYRLGEVVNANSSGKPIWVTEFGWQRCDAKIDLATQKRYVKQAIDVIGQTYPSVAGVIVWNFGYGKLAGSSQEFQCYDIEGGGNTANSNYPVDPNAQDIPRIITKNVGGVVQKEYIGKKAGVDCPPGTKASSPGPGDQMIANSWENDASLTKAIGQSLYPPSIQNDIKAKAAAQKENKTGVKSDFFSQVGAGLCKITGLFCQPDVKIGGSTEEFALGSQTQAVANTPTDFTYYPAKNDCTVFDLQGTNGNEDVNTVQGMKTVSDQATMATLSDHQARVQECIKKLNLTVGNGQMTDDERVCELDVTAKEVKESNFPPGVNPFPEKDPTAIKVIDQ